MKKTKFCLPVHGINMRPASRAAVLSVLLACFCLLTGFSTTNSQTAFLSLRLENATIREVLNEIEKRTEYAFLFSDQLTRTLNDTRVSAEFDNSTVEQILDKVLASAGLEYKINGRQVLIVNKAKDARPSPSAQQPELMRINGVVADIEGKPLPGVNLRVKGTNIGTATKADGTFTVAVPADLKAPVITFTFIGLKSKEVPYNGTDLKVVLEEDVSQVEEVVVQAGIIQRDKLGFTGSFSSFNQEELKAIGNLNPIQALKTLDPGFIVTDNLLDGSNPNVMANIQVRGQTAMSVTSLSEEAETSVNQPLFIMDGFEISLSQFNDLDINRIESITILKDAGSTAIYGSKGANGVIVIETVKPKAGEIFIRYNADVQLSFPDLGVYNLMNAAEKLDFEKQAGRWSGIEENEDYYRRLELVRSGIDTYWLAEPVRNVATHNHSVTVSGGEKSILFDVGLNYKDLQGVMKDSGREIYGGNVKLIYRGTNNFNITNNMVISGVNAHDGSWGSFSDFAKAIPYFKKRNDDGSIPKYLDEIFVKNTSKTYTASNPLYNASLYSYDDDRYFYFTNNTAINWHINKSLRINGALSIKKTSRDNQTFKDPRNTDYASTVYSEKGRYTGIKSNSWSYSGNIAASYAASLVKNHNITLIGRASVTEKNSRSETYTAVGFPEGVKGIPSYAYSYPEGLRPSYSETTSRDASFLAAFNYNYKYRYLLDINYTLDGSTVFGKNKKFHNFWSAGLGWNLDQEEFAKHWNWLTELKLTASIGNNANQNASFATTSVYTYYTGNTQFGLGAYLSQFANPDLEWQETKKKSASLDAGFLNNKLKVTMGVYDHHTEPLIATLAQKPSSGAGAYPFNMGYMDSRGVEFTALYYPVYNRERDIMFSIRLTGAHGNNKYGGYGDALESLNKSYLKSSDATNLLSIQRYEDGRSPNDIWAVRSLGIDPATGKEVFLTIDGLETNFYNSDDRVVVGNTNPDIEGVAGFNLIWKKLQVNANFRYRVGGDALNTALYNKVENITRSTMIYNQDKRALYDRWKTPGDVARFVAITQVASGNPLSSRFVQRDNQLIMESAKVTWDFSKDNWIKMLLLKDLKASVSINDIFRISSIKMERGIDYPFARTIAFNLIARF